LQFFILPKERINFITHKYHRLICANDFTNSFSVYGGGSDSDLFNRRRHSNLIRLEDALQKAAIKP
jgi:hypothetical protein